MVVTKKSNPRTNLSGGMSPHARSKEKLRETLKWIFQHHYTTRGIIKKHLGIAENGYLLELTRKGYLQSVDVPKFHCKQIFMLTEQGLVEAMRHA
jgi:hypothetical protein